MKNKIFYRLASLIIAISLLVGTNLVVHASGQAVPAKAAAATFNPVADAYVSQPSPSKNFGSANTVRVDSSPLMRSYLRFVVTGSTIQSAVLRLYSKIANSSGVQVQAESNNTWTENKINYSNAPAVGSVINTSKAFGAGEWVSIDVSSYITSAGTYSLVMTGINSTTTNFSSRHVSGYAPQLVINGATATKTPDPTGNYQPSFPIRAAFYYPWFAEAWTQQGIYPYTNYTPKLGFYSNTDQNILKQHIAMMQYGNIQAGIASWWGQGSQSDTKIAGLLSAAAGTNFRWALYYENESQSDPTASQIQSDLTYIKNKYAGDPSFLRVNGKFVVFVYANTNDVCGMADRWKQGNTVGAYVVLKVFPGFANCASQPDGWHQYSPAVASDQQGSMSFAISPGFWLKGDAMRLARDINRWKQNVQAMVASGANWQLITTFSEWGEGTAVEPAVEWASPSGYGQYLDVLHTNGQ